MAGFVAMLAVILVVGIEMFFAIRGAGHIHATNYGMLDEEEAKEETRPLGAGRRTTSGIQALRYFRTESFGAEDMVNPDPLPELGTPNLEKNSGSSSNSFSKINTPPEEDSDLELDELDPSQNHSPSSSEQRQRRRQHIEEGLENGFVDNSSVEHLTHNTLTVPHTTQPGSTSDLSTAAQQQHEEQKMLLQCLLLEAGILFHSVFIGMAVSVATGPPFVVLLVAISFHQTFEGLALGSRIAAITSFGPKSPKPWLMALAYGTTTPIGQAIGLAVHNLYDPESETGLLMVGMMNAISSGLLLFAGLVELLAEDFLSDKSYEILQGKKRLQACASVVAGSLLMALVGAWA